MSALLLAALLSATPACNGAATHHRVSVVVKASSVEHSVRRVDGALPKLPLGEEPGRDEWVAVLEDAKGRELLRAPFPAPTVLRAPPGSKPSLIVRDEGASSVRLPACTGAVKLRILSPAWMWRSGSGDQFELVEVASWRWNE